MKNNKTKYALIEFTKNGFTLAEVMVVLFILVVILAAFAPIMTTRTKVNKTSPWTYANPDNANAYFGVSDNQTAMIGQKSKAATDISNKLTINTKDETQVQMLLKQNGTLYQQLLANDTNTVLAGPFESGVFEGTNSVIIGAMAAQNTESDATDNVSIGYEVLNANTTGSYNTAVGTQALGQNTTGSYNTALGFKACYDIDVTDSYITCLGAFSGPKTDMSDKTNEIYLGNYYSHINVYGTTELRELITSSDSRLKNVKEENVAGLDKIKQLKVFNYTFKDDEKEKLRVGVMAQDLQKVFPEAVTEGKDGYLRIRQEDMFYAMINSIKELAASDSAKDQKIKELEKKTTDLEARLEKLEKKVSKKICGE